MSMRRQTWEAEHTGFVPGTGESGGGNERQGEKLTFKVFNLDDGRWGCPQKMPGPKHREDPGSHGIVCAPSEDRKEVAESMRMCPDCFEEAIQEQRKESFQAMADEPPEATHRALCRG